MCSPPLVEAGVELHDVEQKRHRPGAISGPVPFRLPEFEAHGLGRVRDGLQVEHLPEELVLREDGEIGRVRRQRDGQPRIELGAGAIHRAERLERLTRAVGHVEETDGHRREVGPQQDDECPERRDPEPAVDVHRPGVLRARAQILEIAAGLARRCVVTGDGLDAHVELPFGPEGLSLHEHDEVAFAVVRELELLDRVGDFPLLGDLHLIVHGVDRSDPEFVPRGGAALIPGDPGHLPVDCAAGLAVDLAVGALREVRLAVVVEIINDEIEGIGRPVVRFDLLEHREACMRLRRPPTAPCPAAAAIALGDDGVLNPCVDARRVEESLLFGVLAAGERGQERQRDGRAAPNPSK